MKRFAISGCLVVVIALATAQSAVAARIYNFLPVSVGIMGATLGHPNGNAVALAPGQRSDSINWTRTHALLVMSGGVGLCGLDFGLSAELQGGNYMTIGHLGHTVVCMMCNSNHGVIVRNARASTLFDPKTSSRTGC